jgi:hypothetical protein
VIEPQDQRVETSRVRGWIPHHVRLFLLLVAAGLLRYYAIDSLGVFNVDEARTLLDSLSKYEEARLVISMAQAKFAEMRGGDEFLLENVLPEAQRTLSQLRPFFPKLGFNYLSALHMLVRGVRVSTSGVLDATAGLVMVWMTYLLTRRLTNRRAALIAAALLAFSNYHIYFARDGYPQCTAVLIMMAAVACHLRWADGDVDRGGALGPRTGALAACGALGAVSVWVNFQAAAVLPLLAAVHLVSCLRGGTVGQRLSRFVKGGIVITAGFLGAVALVEGLSYPMILLFRSQGLDYPHGTFLELLAPRFGYHSTVPLHPSGLVLFPHFFDLFEGHLRFLAVGVLLVVGLGMLTRTMLRSPRTTLSPALHRQFAYLFVPFLVPFLLFSMKTVQGARMFVFCLPYLFAMVAVAIDAVWQVSQRRTSVRAVVAVLLGVSAVAGFRQTAEVLSIRSGYPDLIDFAEASGAVDVRASWNGPLHVYLIEKGMVDAAGAADGPVSGPRLYVTDWQDLHHWKYPEESPSTPQNATFMKEFEHQFGRIFLEVETFPFRGDPIENVRWARGLDLERTRKILVYRLPGVDLRE